MTRIASASRSARLIAKAVLFASATAVAACNSDPSAPPVSGLAPTFARATSDVVVSSAVPDSASQDTTLDVVVNGSGFVSGAVAKWALAGVTDSTQVRTNSTRYVNSRQLVANVTISGTATIGKWDVIVTAGTKGGIGSELFTIKIKGNIDTAPRFNLVFDETVNVAAPGQPAVMQPSLITGDYRDRTGAPLATGKTGEYQGDFCGMQTLFFIGNDGGYNAFVDRLYNASTMAVPCAGSRYYQFFLSGRAGVPLKYPAQHFVHALGQFKPGEVRLQGIVFGILQVGCNGLRFDSIYPPASDVRITRIPDTLTANGYAPRWRVESQGNHLAMCTTSSNKGPVPTGKTYYMPFAITATRVDYPFPHFP